MADSYGPWRKSYSHRRPSIWCSAVYVDGFCLCVPVVGISLFRTYHRTLSQANCRCHCRFFRLFTSVSDNTLCFSSPHGTTGRAVPRFLHRLSAQDRYELFWGSDVGHHGLQDAVILRIVDTILGVTFGLVFALLFHRLAAVKWLSHPEGKTCTEIK